MSRVTSVASLQKVVPSRDAGNVVPKKRDSQRCDFGVRVGVAPEKRQAREPILGLDELPCSGKLLGVQQADGRSRFGSGDLSTNRAWSDFHLRVVANTLTFSGLAVGHEVKFLICFGEPDRRVNRNATLTEGRQAEVTLAVNSCRNVCHRTIVKRGERVWFVTWSPFR